MATKTDIRRIIKKGLTGKEAGRLVLQDSWEVDHQREGFLSDSDIQLIKNTLKTSQDIQDYNDLIHAYRLIDYTLLESQIKTLQIQVHLKTVNEFAIRYLQDALIEQNRLTTPKIMTQKQYEDLKAAQREELLREINDFWAILESRTRAIAPEGYEEEDLAQYEPEAAGQLLELVEGGQWLPVLFLPEDRYKLDEIEARFDHWRKSDSKKWRRYKALYEQLDQERDKLLQEGFQRAKRAQRPEALEELKESLRKVREGLLELSEGDTTFDHWYSSGEDLYQAGLPDWIEWINEYKHGLKEEGLPGIAILLEPNSYYVDERGYYKDRSREISLNRLMEKSYQENGEPSLPELLASLVEQIRQDVKEFLGTLAVIETISKLLKVDFTEDIEKGYQGLKRLVSSYNDLVTDGQKQLNYLPDYVKLSPISIAKLKPTAKSIRYLRERMAISLGENWWKEGVLKMEFEEPEELEEELEEEAQHG